jgi:hypothetical protein
MERNIHIINLYKTAAKLANDALKKIASGRKYIIRYQKTSKRHC